MKYLNISWPLPLAFLLYSFFLIRFAHAMLHHMHAVCEKNGFLDGQVPRDGVPDIRLSATAVRTSQSKIFGNIFVLIVRFECCRLVFS